MRAGRDEPDISGRGPLPTRWTVLIGVVAARVAFAFQLQSVAVVAPGLMDGLALDAASIGTLTGLFTLPGVVLAIPGGMLGQRFGERRFLVACLVALTVGGWLCGFASNFPALWLGRLISGFGAIGINVAMSKVVIDWFAGREIATAMAIFLAGFPAGLALALVTLGGFATPERWSLAFFAAAAFSLLALIVFVVTYRPAALTQALTGPTVELSRHEILMVSIAALIWALYNAAYLISVSFVPLYLVRAGIEASRAASLVGLGVWISIVAGPLGGIVGDRTRRPNVIIVCGVLLWGFGLLLAIPWSQSIGLLIGVFAVTSVLGSLPVGPIVALASEVLRPQARAAGMGVFYAWVYGGLAVGPMAGGYVSDVTGDRAAPLYLIAAVASLTIVVFAVFRLLQARGSKPALA